MRVRVLVVALCGTILLELGVQTISAGDAVSPDQAERILLELTNADRTAYGLATLAADPQLQGIARQRASAQGSVPQLSHYDADGQLIVTNLLAAASIHYELLGENLARASNNSLNTAEQVHTALMGSLEHRQNILEPRFHRVAVAAEPISGGRLAFAEIFRD